MLEIDLLDAYREFQKNELSDWMKAVMPELGYSVHDESPRMLRMVKDSLYYFMKSMIVVVNERKNGLYFAACIMDEDGEFLKHPAWYNLEKETETAWAVKNPSPLDIGRLVCGVMESYMSGATNIKPILSACKKLKRPNAPKKPWQKRKSEKRLEETVQIPAEAEETPEQKEAEAPYEEKPEEKVVRMPVKPHVEEAPEENYEYVYEYIPPPQISNPSEARLAWLVAKSFHLRRNQMRQFRTKSRVSAKESIAYKAWEAEYDITCREATKIVSAFLECGELPEEVNNMERHRDSQKYKRAEKKMLAAFGVSSKRLDEIMDIVNHVKFEGAYSNRMRKVITAS
jgi:hypothetical protein